MSKNKTLDTESEQAKDTSELTYKDNENLFKKLQDAKDKEEKEDYFHIRNELVEVNMRLVHLVINGYQKKLGNACEQFKDDLEQAGALGLIEAVEKYDPDRKVKFSTFAANYYIKGAVLKVINRQLGENPLSIDEFVFIEDGESEGALVDIIPGKSKTDKETENLAVKDFEADVDRLRPYLTREELDVFNAMDDLKGDMDDIGDIKAVAQRLGITKKRVTQLTMNILERMKLLEEMEFRQ